VHARTRALQLKEFAPYGLLTLLQHPLPLRAADTSSRPVRGCAFKAPKLGHRPRERALGGRRSGWRRLVPEDPLGGDLLRDAHHDLRAKPAHVEQERAALDPPDAVRFLRVHALALQEALAAGAADLLLRQSGPANWVGQYDGAACTRRSAPQQKLDLYNQETPRAVVRMLLSQRGTRGVPQVLIGGVSAWLTWIERSRA
jgi:hypothetical protein